MKSIIISIFIISTLYLQTLSQPTCGGRHATYNTSYSAIGYGKNNQKCGETDGFCKVMEKGQNLESSVKTYTDHMYNIMRSIGQVFKGEHCDINIKSNFSHNGTTTEKPNTTTTTEKISASSTTLVYHDLSSGEEEHSQPSKTPNKH